MGDAAVQLGLARRALVIDLDVHQGDGTAAITRGDDRIFTFSMHGAGNFPFLREASNLDIELPDGAGDETYLAILAEQLPRLFAADPDLVFYLAGADPYAGDRLGKLAQWFAAVAEPARLRRAGRGRSHAMGLRRYRHPVSGR